MADFFVPVLGEAMKTSRIKYLAAMGVFCAFAYVLTNIGNLIPIRFAGFLSFDPKDAMIVIAGFALGPFATVAISLVVSFIEMITISSTGIIGFIMNVISSVAFALLPAIIYGRKRTFKRAMASLGISSIITIILMLLWNYLITPIYMELPREAIADMLLPVFLPFNALKCLINTSLVAVLYKPVVTVMRKIKILAPSTKVKKKRCRVENKETQNTPTIENERENKSV